MLNKKSNTKNPSEGNWFVRHKIWTAVIAVVLLIGFVGAVSDMSNLEQSSDQSNKQENKAEQETTKEEEPQEEQKPEVDLAKQTEEGLKKALAVESFTELLSQDSSSLMGYIASFENVNNSTVRVVIQTNLERDEAQQVGRAIFSNAAYDNDNLKGLDVVVVRDTSGVDKANVYRKDIPLLNR